MSEDKIININTIAADILDDFDRSQEAARKIDMRLSPDFALGFKKAISLLSTEFIKEFPGIRKEARKAKR